MCAGKSRVLMGQPEHFEQRKADVQLLKLDMLDVENIAGAQARGECHDSDKVNRLEWRLRLARESFVKGSGWEFAGLGELDNITWAIVLQNHELLRKYRMLESAAAYAFVRASTNNRHLGADFIEGYFRSMDRVALMAVCDDPPGAGPFVVYRGCWGAGGDRITRGLSWTLRLDCACSFALRQPKGSGCDLVDPAVYSSVVLLSEVFFFCMEREYEVVVRPKEEPRREPLTRNCIVQLKRQWDEEYERLTQARIGKTP